MPAPTTAEELLDLLQKSGLVEEPRLRAYVQKLRDTAAFPTDPNKLAGALVRDALLTYFQAEQLLQGKYKRFTLGKYKVLEKLGSGGMGTVFLCEHKLMRRRVAVKVLPLPKSEDRASLDRFNREARAVAAVDHPNIVRAYDIDQDDNLHFLVMEWVDGSNLQDLVKKFGPLDPLRACHYIYGAAVGLQHAHEKGLIHRDIKPGNILIDRSGVVKILDLGLARLTHDTEDNLTRQNDENVLGTADYLAPEQAMDSHTVDIRADIYSLGATFYYLLTGSPPFPEGSVAQKLIWHQNRPPRPLKSLRPELPDDLIAIVDRMMAKEPAQRFATPSELMAVLSPWVATPIPPPSDREMPTLSPVIANGQGGTRSATAGPTTIVGGFTRPAPATLTGAPTAVNPAPSAPTAVSGNGPAVWATLGSETQSGTREDTQKKPEPVARPDEESDRPSRIARRQPAKSRQPAKRRGMGKLLLGAVVTVAVLTAAAAGAYFAFFNKKGGDTSPSTHSTPTSRRIVVSKGGGEHTVGSLREALNKASSGETIVITDARIVEPALKLDKNKHRDLTIESETADGKPAVIEFRPHPTQKGGVMLDASQVEGVRVRNVEFDGKGLADKAVYLNGLVPGTLFEGVVVRNVTNAGFYLLNVAGDANRPVTFDRARVILTPTCEGGVVLHAYGNTALDNKFIVVRNCRFEGSSKPSAESGKAGIRFDGAALDVEVTNNRFEKLKSAVSFVRPGGRTSRGKFSNNTVSQAQTGLLFEAPVNEGAYEWKVALNYFARTDDALKAQGVVPGLVAADNFYDARSGPGNPPLVATKLDAPTLPEPDPDNDATFLRFPANTGPTTGPGKARVGAH
ncbi:serine/threonine protein kinase [Frigoriglobus tundricola]|uniref:Serine/threonine protein kinase PrkC, regulator of stationary phase n=1 Tax=Frigoriglobus tundricola TaxID=2774151 RepID=A0A6M5YZL3_9BACT|nr:serine/threonine-protein kinase [Frigoriglobus tundricola]QJW98974.1 Serine/threonine protein kinase PrkC, regulator of stationary phase [Frigoriglobus tundricola]